MKEEPIIINKPKKKRRKRSKNLGLIMFVLIFLTLIVAVPYYLFVPKEETYKLQIYELAKVTAQDFVLTIPAKGKVFASEKSVINTSIQGEVVEVYYQLGDKVEKNDLLVKLESETVNENLRKAETLHRQKVKEKERAELEHKRSLEQHDQQIQEYINLDRELLDQYPTYEKLFQLGEISQLKLEEEKKRIEEANKSLLESKESKSFIIEKYLLTMEEVEAVIEDSLSEIDDLKEMLQSTEIRAEVSGKLIELPVKLGQNLQNGTKVAEIINENSLVITGEVNQADIDSVKVGQFVGIDVGGQSYSGQVTSIAVVAKDSNVEIQVDFDKVPANIRPQTAVSLDIEVRVLKDRLALPRGSYLTSGQERYVYLFEGDKGTKTKVAFGQIKGNYVEVKYGLKKGDMIITSSYDNFIHLDEIELNPEGGDKI